MSASERVLKRIRSNKRGRILFPTDFSDITDGITLRQIFARLTIDKTLIRLARGIYLFPVIDEKLGPLIPPLEDIAAAVYFLCSEENTGVTGQFIKIDLGFSDVRNI